MIEKLLAGLVLAAFGLWFTIVYRHQFVEMRLRELDERERAVGMAHQQVRVMPAEEALDEQVVLAAVRNLAGGHGAECAVLVPHVRHAVVVERTTHQPHQLIGVGAAIAGDGGVTEGTTGVGRTRGISARQRARNRSHRNSPRSRGSPNLAARATKVPARLASMARGSARSSSASRSASAMTSDTRASPASA